jgi:hypothetical protein
VGDTGEHGSEARPLDGFARGEREGPHRSSVEAAKERDDFVAAVVQRASLMAPSIASAPELANETLRGVVPGAISPSFSASAASPS